MKTVILAGGLPSILESSNSKIPKPMATIGERPLLWHIMKLFSADGYNDFIICAGFRAELIKEYFLNYYVYSSDITIHLQTNQVEIHNKITEPWRVSIIDTGLRTTTAERLRRIASSLTEDFFVVYGDCISNVDVTALASRHVQFGKKLTVVLAKPSGRNQIVPLDENGQIVPMNCGGNQHAGAWVNACIMVASPDVLREPPIRGDRFEVEILRQLAAKSEVSVYHHNGFWSPVETIRDKDHMQALWDTGNPPWKIWND